jgi:nucleoside-diphosphate-sugar epimerase
MPHPILITGAAGGTQGSTGRVIAKLLLEQGIPVRAFVRNLDARSDELRARVRKLLRATFSAQPRSRRQ